MSERNYSVPEIMAMRCLVEEIDHWDQYDDDGCGVATPMEPENREAQLLTYMQAGTTVDELAAHLKAIQEAKT